MQYSCLVVPSLSVMDMYTIDIVISFVLDQQDMQDGLVELELLSESEAPTHAHS